jgi:hypothetical protein
MATYDVSGSSTGESTSPALVDFTGYPVAESVVNVVDLSEIIRTTFGLGESSVEVIYQIIDSQQYDEVGLSEVLIEGDTNIIRYVDAIVITGIQANGDVAATAIFNVDAESIANLMDGVAFVNDYWDGWSYNLSLEAASFYENFKFNSFAKLGKNYYGMNEDGIHLLNGDDDDGAEIDVSVKTGKSDYGDISLKTIPVIFAGAQSDKEMLLTASVDSYPDYTYQFIGRPGDISAIRVKLGRGLKGRYWQFELRNKDGADFNMDELDIPEIATNRRV